MGNGKDNGEQRFERRTRAVFLSSIDGLDVATRSKLRVAGRTAVADLASPAAGLRSRVWLPAAAAAALLLLIVAPAPQHQAPPPAGDNFGAVVASDLELLLGDEELDMLAELEFYTWLDMQESEDSDRDRRDGVG
jgi:hypothetical protein